MKEKLGGQKKNTTSRVKFNLVKTLKLSLTLSRMLLWMNNRTTQFSVEKNRTHSAGYVCPFKVFYCII